MSTATRERRSLESVTILFSGDSGDGMQLIGTQFTTASAILGNIVCTLPDYPSEIRAPAGSLAGVSAFQVNVSSREIQTPGDRPDALVAMNPAALKVYLPRLAPGGVLIVNSDAFSKSGLRAALGGEGTVDADPLENVENLIGEARKYDRDNPDGSLAAWLEETSLLGDVDTIDPQAGAVTLMTLHAAKGLEFPVIYIVGAEDGLLPMRRDDDPPDIEEERRLCFVGMTRACKELTLTHTRYRLRHGQTLRNVRSPFLDELPAEEIEWIAAEQEASEAASERWGDELADDLETWGAGTLVRHPQYGLGQVLSIRQWAGRHGAVVAFENGEERSFVLEQAELIRVDPYDID